MLPPDRRHFLLAAGALTLSAAGYARAADKPAERVRLAVAGVRGRGKHLARKFLDVPGVEIAYLCDPDANLLPDAVKAVAARQSAEPKTLPDFRKALDDASVTGLVVATPDHWHALATLLACSAGKHVYVEKPVSHNVAEGRRMLEAARRHKVVVQAGTQRRSASHFATAREFIRSGKLGKVPYARAWIAGNRSSIGHKPDAEVPAGVDYDLWTGPAPKRPFNPNRFHYEWHWDWQLGTGEIGNNGVHGLDVLRGLLGLDGPERVTSGGGRLFYDDDRQTPDTQTATFDFPGCTVLWEHRIWAKTGNEGKAFGIVVEGEKGTLVFEDKGWHVRDGVEASDKAEPDFELAHLRNFIECLRDGRRPNADIEDGHRSARLCHLGNIAFRTGRALRFDPAADTITDDAEASKLLSREYRKGFELPTA